MPPSITSTPELKAHLAEASPALVKQFRLRRALRYNNNPAGLPVKKRGQAAYRLPPPIGLELTLGRVSHATGFTFDTAASILTHPVVAELPVRKLILTVPERASDISVNKIKDASIFSGITDIEWVWDGECTNEALLFKFLDAAPIEDLQSLYLHAPARDNGNAIPRPADFTERLVQSGALPSRHIYLGAVQPETVRPVLRTATLESFKLSHSRSRDWSDLGGVLADAESLRFLEIRETLAGDEGLTELLGSGLPALQTLVLQKDRLTDDSVDVFEKQSSKQWKLLDVAENKLTAEGRARLKTHCGGSGIKLIDDPQLGG